LTYFWLPSPDLPGISVACLVESDTVPFLGVGLGCDLTLSGALYKAFLEGVAVTHLAKIILFRKRVESKEDKPKSSSGRIYDLDSNVGRYASAKDFDIIRARFPREQALPASEVAADFVGSDQQGAAHLVERFEATGKRLAVLNLTTPDVAELGFCAVRVWSPDTLSLPLPSAPPVRHPRFAAYGGVVHDDPHPYP
jgi:hypothetical protein